MESHPKNRLSAILASDVCGFSRLMSRDEEGTVKRLNATHELMAHCIETHEGRVVNAPGDALLAEFPCVIHAVACAIEVQERLACQNEGLSPEERMDIRIGINQGDILVEDDSVYGNVVNIAARLEGLADPGGLFISGSVFDKVEGRIDPHMEYLGEKTVKNIPYPVPVYRVRIEGAPPAGGTLGSYPRPDTWSRPSLAVLTFHTNGTDPDQTYLGDGISEDLITDLSKISGLTVIGRHLPREKGEGIAQLQKVGTELGVRYVLEGSVQKEGQRVRVYAKLIDAVTGHFLWAERYRHPLKDIFELQDEITRDIVMAMNVKLVTGEQALLWRKATQNADAWHLAMQGFAHFRLLTEEDNEMARAFFNQAIALDPNYALPVAGLGFSHYLDLLYDWDGDPEHSLQQIANLTAKCLELDEGLGEGYALQGALHLSQRRYDEAIDAATRAVALHPNHAEITAVLGMVLNYAGKAEQAQALLRRAILLSPNPPHWFLYQLGLAYFLTGRFEDATTNLMEAANNHESAPSSRLMLIAGLAAQGRVDEARLEAAALHRLKPGISPRCHLERSEPHRDLTVLPRILEHLRHTESFRERP